MNVGLGGPAGVAFASIRREPRYMMLGQAAGTVAALAATAATSVHDVRITLLQDRFRASGQLIAPS